MSFLDLPGIVVVDKTESEDDYQVHAQTTAALEHCPHCHADQLRRFGTKDQLFMDTPARGKRVGIFLTRKRYQCKSCNKTTFEPLSQMDAKRLCTNRLIDYIQRQSMRFTFTGVAEEVGLDEKTIRNIFRDHVADLEAQYRFDTPRWLGIDEVHLNRTMRCVITNIEDRTLVEMLPSRTKKIVLEAFRAMPDRANVEIVSMDMWRPYKDATNQVFPQVQIVVDKFHVLRMANDAIERIRKATRENLTTKQTRALMNDRYVLLKRSHALTDQDHLKLSGWTRNYPLLGEGYEAKEAFYGIWENSDQKEAQDAYRAWVHNLAPGVRFYFNDLIRAVDNWNGEIFSYFDNRVTNAYTESLNNLIKVAHKVGRGYSFEALRAKMLFSEGLHKVKRPKFDKQRKPSAGELQVAEESNGYGLPPKYTGSEISTLASKLEKGEI